MKQASWGIKALNERIKISIFVILLLTCFFSLGQTSFVPSEAFIENKKTVLNPIFRIHPQPSNGDTVQTNPPVFIVPLVEEKKYFTDGIPSIKNPTHYSFLLSRQQDFPKQKTIGVSNKEWAIFNPHKKLKPGTWFWKYKTNKTNWSPVFSFIITDKTNNAETPSIKELTAGIPVNHPRVLVPDNNLKQLRIRNKDGEDSKRIIEMADRLIDTEPPNENIGIPSLKGSTKTQNSKLALDASKKLGAEVQTGIDPLVKAYVLTGDKKYAQAAVRWALSVADYDPNGVSMINNFGDSECMLQMAVVYDACYSLLTEEEKEQLLAGIIPRADRFYQKWRNMLESKIFSGHVWQHILERMFKTSVALYNEVPDAQKWLHFIYELYLARSPILGNNDGGWWNGTHYMELNGLTLLDLPQYFNLWTGADFLGSPFYDQVPFWLIYSFPPNSFSEGFGNGTEKQFGQKLGVLGFMDALGRIKQNSYASWYARFQLDNSILSKGWDASVLGPHPSQKGHSIYDDEVFRWFRIKWDLPPPPQFPQDIEELPLARVFRETGTANLHTNLFDADNNLMVSMRSSPYGSTSHSHADQNSFNILYGGQKLYTNSGYRPSMGVPHYQEWFKASIGHNTILIDGKGQPVGSGESYGWIPRFLNGETISYVLGDASKAYDNVVKEPQKAGLKLFRRHLIFLRPSILVVYDELEANHKAEWSWLLHSPHKIILEDKENFFSAVSSTAQSRVYQLGSADLEVEISTEFKPKPVNFRQLKGPDGKIIKYKDQWHLYSRPVKKNKTFRYLTVFQIKAIDDPIKFHSLSKDDNEIRIGDWQLYFELNTQKPASFKITNKKEHKALFFNLSKLNYDNKIYKSNVPGSTVLIEGSSHGIIKEAVDKFPMGKD